MKANTQMDKQTDIARILAPLLYILDKLGSAGKHKSFKILYFADKAHIAAYGRTFTGDYYAAMDNGPVPSRIYDFIKVVEGKNSIPVSLDFANELSTFLAIKQPTIIPLKKPDLQYLSRSAIKFLDESIRMYSDKSYKELTTLSHDDAWNAAGQNSEISVVEIAKAAGANNEMLKYIQESK